MIKHRSLKRIVAGVLLLGGTIAAQEAGNPGEAFYAAIRGNDLTQLAAILKQGSGVNAKDERGVTPLMQAAVAGSPEAMKLLLDKGADVNLRNSANSTALMWAVTEIGKVRLLLERGADVNVVTNRGRTALSLAAMSDRSADIVRLLIAAGADVKVVDGLKMTALHAAALGNDLETIRLLVASGLDVNARDFAGYSPLLYASSNGNLAAVRFLIANGADVNAVSGDGSYQKVKAGIIAQGNWTPLLMVAPLGSADLVKTLLAAGAQVNARDVRGMTPLMLAVANDRQNPEAIRALIERGADLNFKSLSGETALDWARRIGERATIDMLSRAGAVETPRHPASVPPFGPADLKTAAQRGLTLMEKTGIGVAANGGCASCHSHNITDVAAGVARDKGLQVDEQAAADRRQLTRALFLSSLTLLERIDVAGSPVVPLFAFGGLASAGYPPDRITDAMIANLVARQTSDGRWLSPLGGINRPPMGEGDIARTALGIAALKAYGPPGRAIEISERIGRARDWLGAASATTTEDRNMQLIGLDCAGADRHVLQRLAKAILAAQRPDGGWAQRPELGSDAYATGQTLVALAKTGSASPRDAAYQKAVKYLLSTQHADGSWFVRSRAPGFQPYFESGFPYGHDQWISAMATGWAAAALATALPPVGQ